MLRCRGLVARQVQPMSDAFFARPVINSPYECPHRHWELENGQPTQRVIESRRRAEFVTPIPKPKQRKRGHGEAQAELGLDDGATAADGQYEEERIFHTLFAEICRRLADGSAWLVITPKGRSRRRSPGIRRS